jgi:hypothetical protein
MAERMILVCDVCGKPATGTVALRVGRRGLTKDLCSIHLKELTEGARPARPPRAGPGPRRARRTPPRVLGELGGPARTG